MRTFVLAFLAAFLAPGPASAHPLGFSSAELRFDSGRCQLELVVDAPATEASSDAERRRQLRSRLRDAVWIEIDEQRLVLDQRIVSLGEGPSAVDVVEFRATAPASANQLRVGFEAGLGSVALEVRNPSGSRVYRALLGDGAQTLPISLRPKLPESMPNASARQDGGPAPAPKAEARREPAPAAPGDASHRWLWFAITGFVIALGVWLTRRMRG